MSRNKRQILMLTGSVAINSILIKPREKGRQNLESVNEPFKLSLVLTVGQLSPLKYLIKDGKVFSGVPVIAKGTLSRKLLIQLLRQF